jgi:hypothetical protein
MNVSIALVSAALNGDPLAKCQVSDILEDHGFKRWPQLNLTGFMNIEGLFVVH